VCRTIRLNESGAEPNSGSHIYSASWTGIARQQLKAPRDRCKIATGIGIAGTVALPSWGRLWASSKIDPGSHVRKSREGCNRIADFPAKCSNLVHPRNLDAQRMVHNRTTNFRKLAAQFVLGGIASASVTLASAWHRPRPDRLRLFDCVRAVRPDGRLHCISAACRYFCCRVGQGE
jgi:hypothetical protein